MQERIKKMRKKKKKTRRNHHPKKKIPGSMGGQHHMRSTTPTYCFLFQGQGNKQLMSNSENLLR
jgi:hypothetical protein